MKEAGSGKGPILIKKYGNRRLYDTRKSRYITLEDLAETVRSGAEVKVVEAKTGRDLTRPVLLQILVEQQAALDLLPVELLHVLLRVQGTMEQVPFAALLAGLTHQFVAQGYQFVEQMFGGRAPAGLGAQMSGAGPWIPRQSANPFGAVQEDGGIAGQAPSAGAASSAESAPPGEPGTAEAAADPGDSLAGRGGEPAPEADDLAAVKARVDALLGKLQQR